MNKPFDSGPVRLSCYSLGRLDVNGMKSLLSVLDVKANRIYNAVGAGSRVRRECLLLRIEVADRHDQTVCAPDPDALTRSEQEIRESADAERCGGRESRFRRTR